MIRRRPFREADQILKQLLGLPESERAAFLSRSCGGDAALMTLVERLLARATADDPRLRPGAGLELLGVETADFASQPASFFESGDRVGAFRLARVLGRGGMATVYLALRADGHFEQTVALKILDRAGETFARFEQERQILAALDHPNTARLLDGGVTERGVPWVAMEYVEGEPLLEYCDRMRLGVEARLRLFNQIVDAVHDAHRKLIIHRDIKSANILVTSSGVPKLLDFGIAKLLAADALPNAAPSTRLLTPMTPEYASPEQIRNDPLSVATDIYQLGYLLYVLLTGRSPYAVDTADVAGLVEAITRRDPAAPSRTVSRFAEPASASGDTPWGRRSTSRTRLHRRLRGDLDRVVLKAMHKDPECRYASAAAFAADVDNVLLAKPISARPDSVAYRARTFFRRHPLAVSASTVAVIIAITGTSLFTYRLAQEKERATFEAARAQEVATFMRELFGSANPVMTAGETLSARDILDKGLERINERLDAQPEVRAALLDSMAYSYLELGALDEAESVLEEAIALKVELFGKNNEDYLETLHRIAMLRFKQGRYAETERTAREVYENARDLLGEHAALTQYALGQLGLALYRQSRFEEAEAIQRRRRELTRESFGETHPDMVAAHNNIAITVDMQGRNDEALDLYREAYELGKKVLGEKHPFTMDALNNMGLVYERLRRFDESEHAFRQVIALRTEALGNEHPRTLRSRQNLASMLAEIGDYDAAMPLLKDLVDVSRRKVGPEHPQTLWAQMELAESHASIGELQRAESMLRTLVRQFSRIQGEDHYNTILTRGYLGSVLRKRGEYEEAQQELETALDVATTSERSATDRVLYILLELGYVHTEKRDSERARAVYRSAIEYLTEEEEIAGSHHGRFLQAWGDMLVTNGALEEAEPVLLESVEILSALYGTEHELTREAARSLEAVHESQTPTEQARR